jgi:hypothetical protein
MDRRSIAVLVAITALLAGCANPADPTSTTVRPPPDLTLLPTGIGRYDVGQPADEVIEGVSGEIGGPDADSTEQDGALTLPECGIPDVRVVTWGSLVLVFAGEGPDAPLFTWSYGFDPVTGNAEDLRRLGLVTDRGVGPGTPRPEVERIYRGQLAIEDDTTIDVATFTIDGDEAEHLAGRFPTTDPDAVLQFLERVPGCTFS